MRSWEPFHFCEGKSVERSFTSFSKSYFEHVFEFTEINAVITVRVGTQKFVFPLLCIQSPSTFLIIPGTLKELPKAKAAIYRGIFSLVELFVAVYELLICSFVP